MLYLELEFQSRTELKGQSFPFSPEEVALKEMKWRAKLHSFRAELSRCLGVLMGTVCINFMVWASWHAVSNSWFDCHDNSAISVAGTIPISSSKRHIHRVSGKSNCLEGSLGDRTSVQILFCCTKALSESLKSLTCLIRKMLCQHLPQRISKEQRCCNTRGP